MRARHLGLALLLCLAPVLGCTHRTTPQQVVAVQALPTATPTTLIEHHPRVRANRSRRPVIPDYVVWASSRNVRALRQCENSGSYRSTPSDHHRGAYQFDEETWQSVGGHGDPASATRSEQDYRAYLLYSKRGWEPWSCRYVVR